MSTLHDFSDPATLHEDADYWRREYATDPIGADTLRLKLLQQKMHSDLATKVANAPEELRAEMARIGAEKNLALFIKILCDLQEVNTAKTPEERIAISAQQLGAHVALLSDAWKQLADIIARMDSKPPS